MDDDDVDRWLDEDLDGGRTAATGGTWADGSPRSGSAEGARRPPWKVIATAAGAVWLAVMAAVVLGGGEDGTGTEVAVTAEDLDGEVTADRGDLLTDPATAERPTAAEETAIAEPDGDGTGVDPAGGEPDGDLPTGAPTGTAPGSTAGGGTGAGGTGAGGTGDGGTTAAVAVVAAGPGLDSSVAWPWSTAAAAITALRGHLTVEGPTTTYLEWATPVAAEPLDAGIWLVVLDAIWLEGQDGTLDRTRTGRWAVPVADDGQPLAPPWPVPGPADPTPLELPPPSGTARLAEVEIALRTAGFEQASAVAADPHPLLPDVVVALVEGGPAGPSATAAIVWFREDAAGALAVMGAVA